MSVFFLLFLISVAVYFSPALIALARSQGTSVVRVQRFGPFVFAIATYVVFAVPQAMAQQIPCDDPSVMGKTWSGVAEPSVCYDWHPIQAANLRAYAQYQRRAQILLTEWSAVWPRSSESLNVRLRAWRVESQHYVSRRREATRAGRARCYGCAR